MGIKRLCVAILVFILLSSTVYAVGFEWALGNEATKGGFSSPFEDQSDEWFRWFTGLNLLTSPVIVTKESMDGHTCANRCYTRVCLWLYYKDKPAFRALHRFARSDWNEFHNNPVNTITDNAVFGGCEGWDDSGGGCDCDFDGNLAIQYVEIDASGFGSIFPKDGIKTIGSVQELYPSILLPENETIYIGLYTKNQGDIMYWFGPAESEPTDPLKKETNDYFDYINACSDLNHNNICDYTDAERCYDEGADWYGDPDWVQGRCCGADPIELKTDTGLESTNCTVEIYQNKAYCGINLNGNYEWAPLNEVGAVHELLNCPGYSTVSDGKSYMDCKSSGTLTSFEQVYQATCPAGSYTALSDYWEDAYGFYRFNRHPQSMSQSEITVKPSYNFDICTSIPDAKAKAFLALPEENIVPDPCDAGYLDAGTFSYLVGNIVIKGRVCLPESAAPAGAKFFTIDSTIGTHGYLCSNGELFECKGDGAPYSWDKDFVADTGISTNDLVGSGGCPPKIIAYWPLNDGTAADYIGTYTGTITGGGSTTGKITGGIHLEQGNKITLPADLPVEGNQFTVEAWVKPTETAGLRNIIEKDDSFRIAIDDQLLVGALHTNQPLGDFGSRRVVSNVWHHVALTYDGDKVSLYLDGSAVTDSTHSGDIVWSDQPIIIGGSFVGDVDEVAIYDRALRSALIKRHAKMPAGYCGTAAGLSENYYCAADAEWTTDLDIKDESSCNKAGFVWTGNFCCSEDDDVNEYYNDHDTPPADLAKVADGGQTVIAHAGAQVSSTQIILTNKNQFATIKGPAKLVIETYSAESPTDIGACPPLDTNLQPIVVAPWEQKTIKILSLGQSGDPCRYRHKIITAEPFLALGGCWDKDFVPIGHFAEPNIINYHGNFYSCGLSSNAPELQIQDTQNDGQLVTPASLTCSDIKLNARGAGTHVVCNPGGKWQFTNNSVATTSSEIVWDVTGTNASQYGCCGEDQCWTGFDCVNIGEYYTDPTSGDSYFCEE